MENRLELLAPAGSFESLKAAVCAGADAAYMGGGRFGARAYADNPEGGALTEAIDYAHFYGVKLYLTVNTLLKERELEQELYEYLRPCYEHGLDAVIVQDVGVLRAVREWFPDLPVHASTQMTVCGAGGARLLEREGIRRIVPARELSLAELSEIRRASSLEIECFVHGALCYCYSGQCLFSSILGGRSGNRGRCAQPCRLSYEALAGRKPVSGGEGTLLSPKDLCAIDLLPQIARAGVCSLKIEGRMKRPEYVAGVVRIYRKYVDRYLQYGEKDYRVSEADRKELLLLFNRDGFSRGYYERHNGRELMALAGRKPDAREKKAYEERLQALRREYVETEKKLPISGVLYAEAGRPMRLELAPAKTGGDRGAGTEGVTVYGECPQVPKNRPMEASQFEKQLGKTGNTPFEWAELEVRLQGPLFVPVQAVNQLRRDAFSKLQERLVQSFWRTGPAETAMRANGRGSESFGVGPAGAARALHISVETGEQLREVLERAEYLKEKSGLSFEAVYVDAESMEEELEEAVGRIREKGLKAYAALPVIFRMKTARRYENRKDWWLSLPVDGYVFRNLEEYEFLRSSGFEGDLISDHNVYTFNRRSRGFWKEKGVRFVTAPLELNGRELRETACDDSIQIVYGRYPMMVTAGCLHKTLDRCRRKTELWMLRDRYQNLFPVKNCCRDCYNVIYNSRPLYLLDQLDGPGEFHAGIFRVMFTTEDAGEVRKVLEQLAKRSRPDGDFTRGHRKRGVE